MGRDRQENRTRGREFVMVTWKLLNSSAYRSLTPSAGKALPLFLGKPHEHYKEPNYYKKPFPFSYGEGRRHGFAPATFSSVIQDLVAKGFVDPVDKGGLRGAGKSVSLFKLSPRWEKFEHPDFVEIDFKKFVPESR